MTNLNNQEIRRTVGIEIEFYSKKNREQICLSFQEAVIRFYQSNTYRTGAQSSWTLKTDGSLYGTREIGRGLMEIPAHAKGYNHKSIGVCLVGGVTEDDHTKAENNFTPEQWKELDVLMRELTDMFPKATIIGHNEISNKDCPSFDVQEWLKDKSYANIKRMMK